MNHKVFHHTVRVPYADVDQMGFVYYANYFVYFEMARNEILRELGIPYTQLEKEGVMLPVIESHCDYKKPAHYDDLLDIFTSCKLVKELRLRMDYEVKRRNTLLVTGYTTHVCMSPNGKVLRAPNSLKEKIPSIARVVPE